MTIHEVGTVQKLLEVFKANIQCNRQADRGPQRVPSADPVPKGEHVLLINAKVLHLRSVGGQGDEVLGNGRPVVAGLLQEPVLGRGGVGDGFLGRERLGSDDEERRLGVEALDNLGKVSSVDVGDKVDVGADLERLQGLGDHHGAQVRAADADVDDVGDLLASQALPGSSDHLEFKNTKNRK